MNKNLTVLEQKVILIVSSSKCNKFINKLDDLDVVSDDFCETREEFEIDCADFGLLKTKSLRVSSKPDCLWKMFQNC